MKKRNIQYAIVSATLNHCIFSTLPFIYVLKINLSSSHRTCSLLHLNFACRLGKVNCQSSNLFFFLPVSMFKAPIPFPRRVAMQHFPTLNEHIPARHQVCFSSLIVMELDSVCWLRSIRWCYFVWVHCSQYSSHHAQSVGKLDLLKRITDSLLL